MELKEGIVYKFEKDGAPSIEEPGLRFLETPVGERPPGYTPAPDVDKDLLNFQLVNGVLLNVAGGGMQQTRSAIFATRTNVPDLGDKEPFYGTDTDSSDVQTSADESSDVQTSAAGSSGAQTSDTESISDN